MHGYSRLGTARSNATSSPPSSPRFRHGRSKTSGGRASKQSVVERMVVVLVSMVFRRRGVLLLAPFLYFSGMLLYMGSMGFDVVSLKNTVAVAVHKRAPTGSVYRSPQVFEKLWPFMECESNGSANAVQFLTLHFFFFFALFVQNCCQVYEITRFSLWMFLCKGQRN